MVICQHIYENSEYSKLMEITYQRHKDYCIYYGFDYSCQIGGEFTYGDWYKVVTIQRLLEEHELVIYLDADTMIFDLDFDLSQVDNPPDTIGVVQFPERHKDNGKLVYLAYYNVGALYIRNGDRVQEFISKWLSFYPGKANWYEQEVFNDIANETIFSLPYKYNYTVTAHPKDVEPIVKGYHSGTTSVWKKAEQMECDLKILQSADSTRFANELCLEK